MLRKFSHIIFSVLLLVSTAGMVISKHFCSGSYVSVSVFAEAESCCGESDCCHNENQVFQLKTDFSAPVISSVPDLAELDILGHALPASLILLTENTSKEKTHFTDEPPSPKNIQTILALKQVYLL